MYYFLSSIDLYQFFVNYSQQIQKKKNRCAAQKFSLKLCNILYFTNKRDLPQQTYCRKIYSEIKVQNICKKV